MPGFAIIGRGIGGCIFAVLNSGVLFVKYFGCADLICSHGFDHVDGIRSFGNEIRPVPA